MSKVGIAALVTALSGAALLAVFYAAWSTFSFGYLRGQSLASAEAASRLSEIAVAMSESDSPEATKGAAKVALTIYWLTAQAALATDTPWWGTLIDPFDSGNRLACAAAKIDWRAIEILDAQRVHNLRAAQGRLRTIAAACRPRSPITWSD